MATEKILSEITGKVWKIMTPEGSTVAEEDAIVVVESMKMEIPVLATCTGSVETLHVAEGDDVAEGQLVATLKR